MYRDPLTDPIISMPHRRKYDSITFVVTEIRNGTREKTSERRCRNRKKISKNSESLLSQLFVSNCYVYLYNM